MGGALLVTGEAVFPSSQILPADPAEWAANVVFAPLDPREAPLSGQQVLAATAIVLLPLWNSTKVQQLNHQTYKMFEVSVEF